MRVLSATLLSCGLAFAQFSDVPREHWAEHAVTHLVDLGILTSYPDGTFQGQSGITRYEAALIILRLLTALNASILEQASGLQNLQEQVKDNTSAVQLALGLIDDTLNQLEALTARLETSEQSLPSAMLLFDEVQHNLEQLEQGFSAALLAQQTNTLDEVDARLSELDAAFKQAVAEFTDERIGQYDGRLQARLGELRAQLDAVGERLDAQQRALEEQGELLNDQLQGLRRDLGSVQAANEAVDESSWSLAVKGSIGVLGSVPQVGVSVSAKGGGAGVFASYETGVFAVQGSYAFSDIIKAEGLYLGAAGGTTSIGIDALLLPPLGLRVNAGYGSSIGGGLTLYHEADHPAAVLPGLDLSATARIALREGGPDSLIGVHARLKLDLGAVQLSPGFLYRRVDMPDGYYGVLGELGVSYRVADDFGLYGAARYGFFTPIEDKAEGRSAPEVELGVNYRALNFEILLSDVALPPFSDHPRFNDASPLEGSGLKVGVRVGYTVTIGGS